MEPLRELELISLSKGVPHTKFSQLCSALGYSYARGQSILATRLNHYNIAMQDILIDWKNKQTDPTQSRSVLASKLRDIDLGALGDKLFKGAYRPNQRDPRDKEMASLQSSPDIYDMKISESLTVGQCRDKLANKYLNSFCKIQKAPWNPNDLADIRDLHTVVTMVKKDAYGKDTKTKEILQGSVDEIFSAKVNGSLPARILISAPAGRGKTTAVAKMAYDWANRVRGSSLENLPLLFAVKLRNTNKQTSIAEAIRSQLLSDVLDLTQDGLHRFIADNQNICHIILDGLDEYAGVAANQSLGSNIIDVMQWKEYPHCRVLVTTRPHLEAFFNQGELPKVYTKMWIEGFSRDGSRQYIDKFFARISNPSHGQDLKVFLEDKPLINELVITPLFCLMVCHLWSEGMLGNDTKTQTELLDCVNLFLMHHANARSKYKITEKKLGKIICKLGEVALAGLLDDAKKLVFTTHDFRKVPAILDKACELGIMSKTTVTSARLPKANETSSTTIEFYHKLAQEHLAGKYLADQTNKYLLRWKISKLDRVLRMIKENMGEYENIIRFAAGRNNSICIRIMERLLANSFLDESKRCRILLDCSAEASGTDGRVYSMVQRCITAQRMVLKSPTVFTVAGMQNLPEQLKYQIREVKFEDSGISADVTSGLWSCLRSFPTLQSLAIFDSSLSFPHSPPELPSITQLVAKGVTSQSYDGLLSSIPSLREIDITVGNAKDEDLSQIQTSLHQHLTGQELTLIRPDEPHSLPSGQWVSGMSREKMIGLGLLISDRASRLATLSGVICGQEETVIDLVLSSTRVMSSSLFTEEFSESLNFYRNALNISGLAIRGCKLTAMVTSSLWFCLRSFPSLSKLTISNSSLSFPSSPPELSSVTRLEAKKVTSQSYEGLLSSLPGLEEIDTTIDDAERDITQIMACLSGTRGQQLTYIRLCAPSSLPLEKKKVSRETMRGLDLLIREQSKTIQELVLSGVQCQDEEDLVYLVESCRHIKTMDYLELLDCGSRKGGRLELHIKRVLSPQESLRVFLRHENNPAYGLEFELPAMRVMSESLQDLRSPLPGLKEIDITIDDAEKDISQITADLRRTGRQQLTDIRLRAPSSLPSGKKKVSRETMRELGLLIRDQTENIKVLGLSGVHCQDEDDLVGLVESCRHAKTMDYLVLLDCGSKRGGRLESYINGLLNSQESFRVFLSHEQSDLCIEKCQLSTEMTTRLWSFLKSITSLDELKISDSSLSFPPTPPELSSVKKLTTVRVTPESYEGLLSSLPGLKEIDFTMDNAERDIAQITAGLRRTGGQQFNDIRLRAPSSLPSGKKKVSRATMRELGFLIRDKTENVQVLGLSGVQCQDEDDLIDLVESCRHVRTMNYLELLDCGSKGGGRLESYISELLNLQESFRVFLSHSDMDPELPTNPSELNIKGQYPESPSLSSATATDTQPQSHNDLEHSTDGDRIIGLDEYSVEVRIPADEADSLGDVAVEALTKTPPDLVLSENEVIISVGLKVSSSKRTFETPVKVTLPHCAFFTSPEKAELVLYNRTTDSESFVATPCTAVGIPRCVVREKDLDIYIGHFSEWWIAVIITEMFIGKYVFFTPYIPKEIHKNRKHFLHLCIKDENNRKEQGIEDHKIVYRRVSFFVNWWRGDIAITYRQDEKKKHIKNIKVNKFHYRTDVSPCFPLNIDDVRQSLISIDVKQIFTTDMTDIKFYIYITDDRLSSALPPATPGPSTEAGTVYMFLGDEEEVTDECLLQLSKRLLPDLYNDIHVALGVEYSIAADIRGKNISSSDKYYDLFQKWKVRSRRTGKDLKEVLAKANQGGLTS